MIRKYSQCKECEFDDSTGFGLERKCVLEEDMDIEEKCEYFEQVKDAA